MPQPATAPHAPLPVDGPVVVYDAACAVCGAILRRARFRAAAGPVRLVDSRSADPLAAALRAGDLRLSCGIVVVMGDTVHHGAQAMMMLAALTRRNGLADRAAGWAFASPARARLVYAAVLAAGALAARLRPLRAGTA